MHITDYIRYFLEIDLVLCLLVRKCDKCSTNVFISLKLLSKRWKWNYLLEKMNGIVKDFILIDVRLIIYRQGCRRCGLHLHLFFTLTNIDWNKHCSTKFEMKWFHFSLSNFYQNLHFHSCSSVIVHVCSRTRCFQCLTT